MFNTRFVPLRTIALCACLLSFIPLAGCGGSASSNTPVSAAPVNTGPVISAPRTSNGLQFTLSANKSTYAVGELVGLTFAVTNTTTQPVAIAASSYANQNDLFQALQNNKVVWTLPQGATMVVVNIYLEQRKSKRHSKPCKRRQALMLCQGLSVFEA